VEQIAPVFSSENTCSFYAMGYRLHGIRGKWRFCFYVAGRFSLTVICRMTIWKITLIGLALLSIPWLVLKLVLYVCKKDQQQQEAQSENDSIH
jgi:hypothetical protein